jgi:protein-tyrosine-phosphatase/predicted ATP-grasp superfamily ATP-dependent carboligase
MRDGTTGRVLVLGRDTRAFLSVIRSLGRGGLEVHAAWPHIDPIALRSRYLTGVHDLTPYTDDPDRWSADMSGLLEGGDYDLLIPCNDTAMAAVQEGRSALESFTRLAIPDTESYRILSDKAASGAVARAGGVPVPRDTLVTRADDPIPELGLPLVLKPITSFDATAPSRRRTVVKVRSRTDLRPALDRLLPSGPVLVQENVMGRGVGVELLLKDGRPLMTFQHVRVHEPLMGGGSSYRMSQPVDRRLLDAAIAILEPLRYTGVAMVEFKVDGASGRFAFIEVNARFWGSLPLALAAGADFPRALYGLLVMGEFPRTRPYRRPVFCRNLTADLEWQAANLRADKGDRTLATRPVRLVARDALLNLVLGREHVDTFARDDPAPAAAELRQLVGSIALRVKSRLWIRMLISPWGRRRLTMAARSAWVEAGSVLFVCKGNVCRSPFAEAVLKRDGVFERVTSAGYHPLSGRAAPDLAIVTARELGIDLKDHRSRILTRADLDGHDAIFVFDIENRERLIQEYPDLKGRLHWLGSLVTSGSLFVADPWSGTIDDFRRAYSRILEVLEDAVSLRSGLHTT